MSPPEPAPPALPARPPLDRGRAWIALCAVLGAAVAAAVAQGPLGGVPHVLDETTYLFQAELLRRLTLHAPIPPLGGANPFTILDGELLVGVFPNGWPAVLAAFRAVGVPYVWVNPLLTGLLVWRGARLAERVAGEGAGRVAAPLLALSPQLLLLGASQMSHTLVALTWVLAWEALAGGPALGLWIAVCFLARPLCGVVLGLSCLLAAPRPARRWAWAALPIAVAVALQLAQNHATTGSATRFAVDQMFDRVYPERVGCNRLGFGADRGCGRGLDGGYGLVQALTNAGENLRCWAWLLLGPGLVVLPFAGLADRAARPWVTRWLAAAGLLVGAYGLYWYQGTCFGARFYHGAAPLLVIAAGVGLAQVPVVRVRIGLVALVAAIEGIGLVLTLPELDGYWGIDGRVARLVGGWSRADAAILVDPEAAGPPRAKVHPYTGPSAPVGLLPPAGAWPRYQPAWPDDPVWLGELSPDTLARARDSGREVWIWRLHWDAASDELVRVRTP